MDTREMKIVKYVVKMLKKDDVDLLLGRMEVLLDLMQNLDTYHWEDVVSVICRDPEEDDVLGKL